MSETRARVERSIHAALQTVLREPVEIDSHTDLATDVGLDSLQVMNMTMEIEDELDVSIPVEVLGDVRTVDDLARRIMNLMAEQSS